MKVILAGLTVAGAVALLTACGGAGDKASPTTAPAASQTTGTTTPEAQSPAVMPNPQPTKAPAPTPTSDPPKESASDAAKRYFDIVDKAQWGPMFDMLHPSQQALVPRILFFECMGTNADFSIDTVKIIDTYQEEVDVPGTLEKPQSTAVTAEYSVRVGVLSDTRKDTRHFVAVGSTWRWLLPGDDIDAYKAGKCPS